MTKESVMKDEYSKLLEKNAGRVLRVCLYYNAHRTTLFISEKLVITATRKLFRKRTAKLSRNNTQAEFVVKIGRPNYAEREFIKKCKKAGEPFPVKKIQFRFPPVPRKKQEA